MSAPMTGLALFAPWAATRKSKNKATEGNSMSSNPAVGRDGVSEPGKGKHSAQLDSCVSKVKKSGSADNAYAVCTKSVSEASKLNFNGHLKESDQFKEAAPTGKRFRVVLLQEGMGNMEDCFYYTASAIESAVPLFEGKKFFIDHADAIEEEVHPERSVRDVGGYFENISAERDETGRMCLVGDLVTIDSPDIEPIRARMLESLAYSKNHPDSELIGLSINAGGDFTKVGLDQFIKEQAIPEACMSKLMEAKSRGIEVIRPVNRMTFANSCDLVTQAGAGGKVTGILEQERGNMAKKFKEAEDEKAKEAKQEEAKKESAGKEEEGKKESEDGGAKDGDHADADKDAELIKSMMKKYLGDGFTDEDHSMAHEAYQHAMEACGGDKEEAMKMAGYNMKMARHLKGKEATKDGGAAPDMNQTPASGPADPHMPKKDQEEAAKAQESDSGSVDLSKKVVALTAENARMKTEIEGLKLDKFIDAQMQESKLPHLATKKFRECIKGVKTQKEVSEKLAIFKEAWTSAGRDDGFPFVIAPEKSSGESREGMSFSDCVED